jgi:hypothetical protein
LVHAFLSRVLFRRPVHRHSRPATGWATPRPPGRDGLASTLWRNAELVYEGNPVLRAGERFDGTVEPAARVVDGYLGLAQQSVDIQVVPDFQQAASPLRPYAGQSRSDILAGGVA